MNLTFCLNELKKDFKASVFTIMPRIVLEKGTPRGVYNSNTKVITIYRNQDNEILRIIYETFGYDFKEDFEVNATRKFNKLSLMVDMARNNVMKVESVKRLIRYISLLGYTSLKLYLEDLFEIKEEPYFGYLRGRYSKEELVEIVEYASFFGIDVIPCIQTLAHLNALKFFCPYRWNFDIDDILLVDSETTNRLIENMFKTLKEIFKVDIVNIGMDEAHHLGRGKYLDEFGYKERSKIFLKHLKKVLEIAKKYGFKCEMWSDMFFNSSTYAYENFKVSADEKLDDSLRLVYWDYNAESTEYFEKNIKTHLGISKNIGLAGATWRWLGFVPNNLYAQINVKNFMEAGEKLGIDEFTVTAWGDNGGETPIWSVLPTISYAANLNIKEVQNPKNHLFKELSGKNFDNFMKIDHVAKTRETFDKTDLNSLNRIYMYNDILLGVYDTLVNDKQIEIYEGVIKELTSETKDGSPFNYLFRYELALTKYLASKVEIGIYLRNAYQAKDKEALRNGIKKLNNLENRLNKFYEIFYETWHKDSKANGFDVQDLRLGGVKQRIKTAKRKILDYLSGKIDKIEELEEKLLDFYGNGDDFYKPNDIVDPRYLHMSSVNVND